VIVRLENINDKYDNQFDIKHVNLKALANHLYKTANPTSEIPKIDITELNISGNMPIEDVKKQKHNWIAEVSEKVDNVNLAAVKDFGFEGVALEPQRIR
jgi:hypothetical protein